MSFSVSMAVLEDDKSLTMTLRECPARQVLAAFGTTQRSGCYGSSWTSSTASTGIDRVRIVCVVRQVLASTAALATFGITGAVLGGAGLLKGSARVILGGWLAMGITYGFGRLFTHGATAAP
jgi:hypothetical protein